MTEVPALLAAAAPVVVHVTSEISTWEKVAASFTAVGGLGAAVSAFFSWRSARHSQATARDAREALAASLKPNIVLDFQQRDRSAVACALVVGPMMQGGLSGALPATDLRLEFSTASGRHGSEFRSLMQPNEELTVVIAEATAEWPPPEGDHTTATLTYSDIRSAGTYRLRRSVDLHRPDDEAAAGAGLVSFREQSEQTET